VNDLFSGLRAALFDLDGTLIETHIDFDHMRAEVARLALSFGLDVPPPRDILGGVAALQQTLREAGRDEEALRFRSEAFAMLQEIEDRQCGTPVEVPGAARLLQLLELRGVAVGVVTRNCRLVSERLLAYGDLRCRCLLTRDDVPRAKPDPGHLLAALALLNDLDATEPRPTIAAPSCLMAGDHFMDVQAGRAAGMRTVGVLHGKPASHFDACPPDLLLQNMGELLAMVEALP
jgi:phosphoglycolate phosphatase